jgi:TatD DNase family protein
MPAWYVDSHCHLDDPAFEPDRDAVIERAEAAGVRYLLVIGGSSGPDDVSSGLRIAELRADEREPRSQLDVQIYAAGGIHPHEAGKARQSHFEEIRTLAQHPRFLAIGEIGLDYHYDHSPRSVQREVLIAQLELARELKLPVIIHCRDAWVDVREIIRAHWHSGSSGGPHNHSAVERGILHCFSGTAEDACELMDLGFMVSFAGNITFKKADGLREVASQIPRERLLTETDCPYLAPVPYRGKRNEPAFVREVTRELAIIHGISEEDMAHQVALNFAHFFGLTDPGKS